jgi:hypothetical protein
MRQVQQYTRTKQIILGNKDGFSKGRENVILDLRDNGVMGFQPDYPSYLSNASYIKRNMIPFLVQAPRGFKDLDPTGGMTETLKALVELHAKTIDGLNSTLTVDWSETAFGGAGEMQQDVTNVMRERSVPNFTWVEKYGKPINRFLELWITGLLMDPATKYPGVVMDSNVPPADLLPDYIAATMLFIEPDPTHTRVVEAWLCTNMMPKTAGENIGKRDITTAGDITEVAVEFSAITQVGRGVRAFAQNVLDSLTLKNVNPNSRPAFMKEISNDLKTGTPGYSETMAEASQNTVPNP